MREIFFFSFITSYDELKEYDFEKMEKKPYLNYVW